MKDIMDWMITEKIAKNDFNASAIVNGLELHKISVTCTFENCQEGHYPLGYQDYENGEGEVVWGACPCCNGFDFKACPKCSDEARKARVRLYRDWRNAGEKSKIAFEHAIKGDVIQALPIEGALLSEKSDEWHIRQNEINEGA